VGYFCIIADNNNGVDEDNLYGNQISFARIIYK